MKPPRPGFRIAFAAVLMAAFTFISSPARACGRGGGGVSFVGFDRGAMARALGAIVVGTVDLGLTVYDGVSAGSGHSAAYGVVETLIAGPQVALGIVALSSNGPYRNGGVLLYTLWMSVLSAHGIWTIASAASASPAPIATIPRSAPPPNEPEPLLQVTVGPTWVPVGQLAQTGIGLVGRF